MTNHDHLPTLEDPMLGAMVLRAVALGGADGATRTQVIGTIEAQEGRHLTHPELERGILWLRGRALVTEGVWLRLTTRGTSVAAPVSAADAAHAADHPPRPQDTDKPLQPGEDELIGSWVETKEGVRADDVDRRIRTLVTTALERLTGSEDGWRALYRDPADGRLWVHAYPLELYGGGPQLLYRVDRATAAALFAIQLDPVP